MNRTAYRSAKISRVCTAIMLAFTLNACVTDSVDLAPPSPSAPWRPNLPGGYPVGEDFLGTANDHLPVTEEKVRIDESHQYLLPELIDIAQRQNPETRVSWQQARQAALAVGLAEAVFLPIISASVVGGYQRTHTPVNLPIVGHKDIETTAHATVPALVMQWLLFDFGQRKAILNAAKQTSFAANIAFNGVHQKIIFDVTNAYYHYGAAQARIKNTLAMKQNSGQILAAVQARRAQGVATVIEVAQAKQLVAQAEMNHVVAENAGKDAKQQLFAALGVPATTVINIASPAFASPVVPVSVPDSKTIRQALVRRPDVLASYAIALAAKEGIDAAEADYLPKIYTAGVLAGGHGRFDVQGVPSLGQQTSSSSILVGVTVPLYDGGIRAIRVKEAEARAAAAHASFEKTRDMAAREIIVAANALQSAAAANKASINLVNTAQITYDAAFDSYKHGVGTVTLVNEAANNLLTARQTDTDARTAVLVSAANLAFVMGEIAREGAPEAASGGLQK